MTFNSFYFATGKADDMVDMPAADTACFARIQTQDSGAGFDASLGQI
ncbi:MULTISPECIES: hypothetical protein [unclassified Microcoleus]